MDFERIRPTNAPLRLLEVVITYILIILAHGYIFGHRDMIEITPYVKYLLHLNYTPMIFLSSTSQKGIPMSGTLTSTCFNYWASHALGYTGDYTYSSASC